MKNNFLHNSHSFILSNFWTRLHGIQRMGDRYTISNTLYNIFTDSTTESSDLSKLQEILFDNILSKQSIFGVPCDYYEARLDPNPVLAFRSVDTDGVTDSRATN